MAKEGKWKKCEAKYETIVEKTTQDFEVKPIVIWEKSQHNQHNYKYQRKSFPTTRRSH
jgi:hypothetical protein